MEGINRDITEEEITKAIKGLIRTKSPEVDGLGSAFYNMFASDFVPALADVYSGILRRTLKPPSMRKALVVLIPKKHSMNLTQTGFNFRPISLVTTDYESLAKILTSRLKTGLRQIVESHQSHGFEGRSITNNIHIMRILCKATET